MRTKFESEKKMLYRYQRIDKKKTFAGLLNKSVYLTKNGHEYRYKI